MGFSTKADWSEEFGARSRARVRVRLFFFSVVDILFWLQPKQGQDYFWRCCYMLVGYKLDDSHLNSLRSFWKTVTLGSLGLFPP